MGALIGALAILIALSHAPGLLRLVAARLGGMRIERVVVGVGPIFRRGKWVVGAIPIGTFVVIAGRDAVGVPASPKLFSQRSWPWKLLVLLAGPIAFYLISAGTMAVTYVAFGEPMEGERPMIGGLRDGLPAARAGLQIGDQIVAIDGKAITRTDQVAPAINAGGEIVIVEVVRGGERRTFTVAPVSDGGGRRIGIEIWPIEEYRRGPAAPAVWQGVQFPARYLAFILHGWGEIFAGKRKAEFSGPVGIVKVAQRQASQGLRQGLQIIAIYSVYFGFWLLWPLPMFDGGRLIGYVLRRKTSVEPRDCGDVGPRPGRMPVPLILTLALIGAALTLSTAWNDFRLSGAGSNPGGTVILLIVAVGIVNRHPAAWNWARTVPVLSAFALLQASTGPAALLLLPIPILMSLRAAQKWFGLHCPACDGGVPRPVLAQKQHFGCLRCGSSWISRS